MLFGSTINWMFMCALCVCVSARPMIIVCLCVCVCVWMFVYVGGGRDRDREERFPRSRAYNDRSRSPYGTVLTTHVDARAPLSVRACMCVVW